MLTYREAIEFLHALGLFGAKFGLATTRRLAALAGNPHERLRFIHVAGTNGKGSTCAMLESIYRAAGLRVGLFTSPHLVSFAERIQVDRRLISESDLARLVEKLRSFARQFPADESPTMFEVATVLALLHFEETSDSVIWENRFWAAVSMPPTSFYRPPSSPISAGTISVGSAIRRQNRRRESRILKPGVPVITQFFRDAASKSSPIPPAD
jgi:dihydrofolate synthase/folylpolyglutamate synthase